MQAFNLKFSSVLFLTLLSLLVHGCASAPNSKSGRLHTQISERLKHRVTWTGSPFRVQVFKEPVHAEVDLPKFYKRNGYQAIWIFDEGMHPRTQQLLEAIEHCRADALNPADFHTQAIQTLIEDWERRRQLQMTWNVERFVDLELLLTDAFLTLAQQMHFGKIKPNMPGYEYFVAQKDKKDASRILDQAVSSDNVQATLQSLLPQQTGYQKLKEALADYRKIDAQGGWRLITPGQALHVDERDNRVLQLRHRLKITKDLDSETEITDPKVFDQNLQQALQHFQSRHGIPPDGVLGKGTVSALNVSVKKRIRQMEINLERWRWLPKDLGEKHLQVNIANYELQVVENDRVAMAMPVAVGTQYRSTPSFTGLMTHLVFNPYWFVPKKIAVEDMLPKIKKHPAYLQEKDVHVFKIPKKGPPQIEVNTAGIAWEKLDDENFPYVFRQTGGPFNPLGKVKFMFPNKFNVYLHDTPSRDIFKKSVRDFSSGCIRVSKPMDLAQYLLDWDSTQVREVLANQEETPVPLPKPVLVHLLYRTAWVDEQGPQFRWDVYNQDELLEQFF